MMSETTMNPLLSQYLSYTGFYYKLLPSCVPLVFIFAAYLFLIRRARLHSYAAKLPKYDVIPSSTVKQIASKQVLRDLDGNVDVVIVGSGIGALSTAVTLSRQGFKVAVFEQNQTVGGCTHTFEEKGFEFDVGVHYVGGFSSAVRSMYDTLSDNQLKWTKMDKVYDVMYNSKTGERIEMTDDHCMNRKRLSEHFGIEDKTWEDFDTACFWANFWAIIVNTLKLLHPLVLRCVWYFVRAPYCHYSLRPTSEVLKELGFSLDAAGALTYHYGDHAVPPYRCPFFMTALLDTHYSGGAYFPRGGSRSIAKTLVAAIERRGGHVFSLSPVEEILTEKNMFNQFTAVGVRVRGVDVHTRKFVVSDAGFLTTFGVNGSKALVGENSGARQRLLMHGAKGTSNVIPCISTLFLFIGLDRTDEDIGLPAQNVWHMSTDCGWDHDQAYKAMLKDETLASTADHTPYMFISNTSAKDPDYSLRHPGKSASEIIAFVKYDLFAKWANTTHESRAEEYVALKEQLIQRYLEAFYLHYPRAKGHVAFASLGTPITNNQYLGRQRGELYGLDHNVSRFDSWSVQRALHPQTTLQHLFLTGSDSCLVSVTGCMISGYITAARITWKCWLGMLPFVVTDILVVVMGMVQVFFGK